MKTVLKLRHMTKSCLQKMLSGANELGYAFTVTTSEGYGGDIQFAMGVQYDGTLNGISILSISETAGLGMRATQMILKISSRIRT